MRESGRVDLVDDQDDRHLRREGLAQHEARLGQRALGRVDEQDDRVDHREAALDLTTEVGVPGGVDDVDRHAALGGARSVVADGGVLGEDRDALLALEVAGVHGTLGELVVLVEVTLLLEHGVDQRGLAVVDVGDDCDVAQVGANGHAKEVLSVGECSTEMEPAHSTGGRRAPTNRVTSCSLRCSNTFMGAKVAQVLVSSGDDDTG